MSPSTPEFEILYANKRWGHGQFIRLVVRAWHRIAGHNWGSWNMEPPVDWMDRPVTPQPHDKVYCFRACQSWCGALQQTVVPFSDYRSLPDE